MASVDLREMIYISPAYEKIWGRTCESLYADPISWAESIHPDDRARVSEAILPRTPHGHSVEYRILHPDGGIRWLLDRGFPVYNATGEVYRMAGIAEDITERKRIEEALRENEDKYRRIFENGLMAICVFDSETLRIVDVNDTQVQLYGYTREELTGGMTAFDLTAEGEASAISVQQTESVGSILAPLRYDKKKDGTVFPVEIVAWSYSQKGRRLVFGMARDISERMQMQEALRRSEERYRHIVEHAIEGIFQYASDGSLLSVNPAFARMFGFDSSRQMLDEVHNITEQLYVHPEDRLRVLELSSEERLILGFEAEMRKRNGKTFWMSLNSGSIRDANGEVLCHDGFASDITDRKLAENAEKLHLSVMETVAEGIFLVGAEDKVIKWTNCNFEEMFGYASGEMIGMHVDKLNAPTEKTPAETRSSIVDSMLKTGEWHGEIKNIKKDGTHFWCHAHVSNLDHPEFGKVMVSAHTDINDRKQTEEALLGKEAALRGILNAASESIFLFSPDGIVITSNEMARRRYDKSAEEVIGKHFSEILRTELAQSRLAHLKNCVESGKTVEFEDQRGEILFHHTLYPVFDSGERVTSVVCFSRDVTERKRAEEERLRLEKRLQQTQKAESLGRMAAAIAHNFNNKLAAVIGNLEIALDDVSQGTELQTCIIEAMNASQKAAKISRFMLTYLGQTVGNPELMDFSKAKGDACSLLMSSLPGNVRLRVELPSFGPVIKADCTHLTQILSHLVANAAEAVGEQDGNIDLTLGIVPGTELLGMKLFPLDWQPQSKEYAFLSITDTGCGIDPKNLDKIFDPFFSTKFQGRGLGLAVVTGLVRGFEGAISVESHRGRGATFKVFIPTFGEGLPASSTDKAPIGSARATGGLVLVVDDEPAVLSMAVSMLKRKLGYEAVTACNGSEALEIFRARKAEISLVLLDLSMPGMNGWETLSALKSIRPDIPVILASGYDEAQVMHESNVEKPQAFLHKPYRSEDLMRVIAACRNDLD